MAPEVAVMAVQPESVTLTAELPGRASAFLIAEVRPQVNGLVQKRLFTEGSDVKAGDALYQLDTAPFEAALENAEAALGRASASLPALRMRADRAKEALADKAVSQQDVDDATAALNQAEADARVWEAMVRTARINLGYARITAPIGGRIGKSSVTQGALVTANQQAPLATVQQLDPIFVDLTQSSAELLALRQSLRKGGVESAADLPVTILLEDGTRHAHDGKLEFVDVTVDPTTGSYLLRVVVPNPDHVLLPGMYVRAVVGRAVRQDALLVPQRGVARDPKGHTTAMLVNMEGKVEARAIEVSQAVGDQWLVEGGLVAGDRVIVAGLQKIRPGAPVVATEDGAAPAPAPPPAQSGAQN